MGNKDTVRAFSQFYDEICAKADAIFTESNMCQWEKNPDGSLSCITNRHNSKNRPLEFMETDGCCIEICKNPGDFNDSLITRRQHNSHKGCLVKSLKCKLHICDFLVRMSRDNPDLKKCISEIKALQENFSARYPLLWREIPYAAAKVVYVEGVRGRKLVPS